MTGSSFARLYRENFTTILADTDSLREQVYRIRHQVYCVEHDWEAPSPDGLETDEYDSHASHALLQFVPAQRYVGTVRLVSTLPLDPGNSYPVQAVTDDPTIKLRDGVLPPEKTAEACRICISKEARQTVNDVLGEGDRVVINSAMIVGLMKGLVMMSEQAGIEWWTAEMPRAFIRHLRRLGFPFTSAGPLVENRGKRQPCYTNVEEMLLHCFLHRPDVYEIMGS